VEIAQKYCDLKINELQLIHEYNLKKYREAEEARARRENQREEEKAILEIEREQRKAEQEELQYMKAINKVKREIEGATGIKYEQLSEKIKFLEEELQEAKNNKERALSMAQQTKRGYVYIISNIGSFGDNIYKIGMTRRLDPVDRIRELSNASVPFKYDIHAMLFSEDAPSLEALLHNAFEDKRVNRINGRKEFFGVSLMEIEQKVKESGIETEFIKIPEARDYRETLSILEFQEKGTSEDKAVTEIKDKYYDSLYDYEEVNE
jgi:hypothetical protein